MADDTVPRRYKSEDELSVGELVEVVSARRNDKRVPRFETPDYRRYRRDVLREGGLEGEADELEASEREGKPLEEMSPGEHFDRMKREAP